MTGTIEKLIGCRGLLSSHAQVSLGCVDVAVGATRKWARKSVKFVVCRQELLLYDCVLYATIGRNRNWKTHHIQNSISVLPHSGNRVNREQTGLP